jgi:NADPH-dependent glutamate synthase beta subunit-like oxidoreductase/NAD(P)H-flavin reductase
MFKKKIMSDLTLELNLSFNLTFADLYNREGLIKLDQAFFQHLEAVDPDLFQTYSISRDQAHGTSDLLIQLVPHLEDFIGQLFGITKEIHALQIHHHQLAVIPLVKRLFVQKVAVRRYPPEVATTFEGDQLRQDLEDLLHQPLTQLTLSQAINTWLKEEASYEAELDLAARYCAWAVHPAEGQKIHHQGALLTLPQKRDWAHLVDFQRDGDFITGKPEHHRRRDGFKVTDPGVDRVQALDQATYCIWCHHQGKDSCSKGLKPKGDSPDKFQKNPLGTVLNGCPLEEKISEMNEVKSQGYTLGALAIITIDNPLVAATGHRICNDCMNACIYQKQDPVAIPAVETQILRDVLTLPWGFEIYSLFTRWNPLNFDRPFPRETTNQTVLVVGMGPAGFTLAHHLINDGHHVVGIDGLKIEPLPPETLSQPIRDIQPLMDPLDQRLTEGFGGVAEYGITVRWDKNFLKLIRLLLERRSSFALFGGVRFGGTLTVDQAFEVGFDHVALCMGAGSPTLIPMRNSLAIGVRQASDFLMALQLTGAGKADSLANLQMRLPAVVIGGGLTAIDTATEVLAYYPVQVEKFTKRFRALEQETPAEDLLQKWPPSEQGIVQEFLAHGMAIIAERTRAEQAGEVPNFLPFLQKWGGVTVAYRRDLTEAPSYTLNPEEVAKALEEGIRILDHATPEGITIDTENRAVSIEVSVQGKSRILPARTILVAAGTKPNINLTYDDPNRFKVDGKTFQAIDRDGIPVSPERTCKPDTAHVLMAEYPPKKYLSFFGDLHPSYAGNVVKAMASAKQGYPVISQVLKENKRDSPLNLSEILRESLSATVEAVNRLTPTIVEIVVKAPLQAKNFRPGQFYRLQNFESLAPHLNGTRLAMEGLAVTGASVDGDKGLVSVIVLDMGGSSSLCQYLKPGEPIVLMGPTGEPTPIPENETVLLIGGGLGNAVLFSIGQAMRQKGCRVLYVAGYKSRMDRYKIDEIEKAADLVIWSCDEAPGFIPTPTRPQDKTVVGTIVQAIESYGKGDLGVPEIPLCQVDRVMVIGSDRLMAAVAAARHGILRPFFKTDHLAIGSINSPMQCMMKEICAQCLQRHVDPETGQETIVYSCRNQDQKLDWVDFESLHDRLNQNSIQEKLTAEFLKNLLTSNPPSSSPIQSVIGCSL